MDEPLRRKMTYRDMLMGEALDSQTQPLAGNGMVEDGISDDEDDDRDEEGSKCPTIKVSCEKKKRLRSKWQRTLIIKLIGHSIGFNFLERRLHALWRIEVHIDVVDVGIKLLFNSSQ